MTTTEDAIALAPSQNLSGPMPETPFKSKASHILESSFSHCHNTMSQKKQLKLRGSDLIHGDALHERPEVAPSISVTTSMKLICGSMRIGSLRNLTSASIQLSEHPHPKEQLT